MKSTYNPELRRNEMRYQIADSYQLLRNLIGQIPSVQTGFRANIIYNYPGMIRAWHRHARRQIDHFVVLNGAMRIVAYDGNDKSKTYSKLVEIVASEQRMQIVSRVVNNLFEYAKPDEERRPWNDDFIKNPRTGRGYDWNYAPHK